MRDDWRHLAPAEVLSPVADALLAADVSDIGVAEAGVTQRLDGILTSHDDGTTEPIYRKASHTPSTCSHLEGPMLSDIF